MKSNLLISAVLALGLLVSTTAVHFEALRALWSVLSRRKSRLRRNMVLALTGVVAVHLVEIGLYAAAYGMGAGPLHLGSFVPARHMSPIDLFYYAAETYSALGYGDVIPVGYLRLIASVSPLNGSLLLAWSGSFLFLLIQDDFIDTFFP